MSYKIICNRNFLLNNLNLSRRLLTSDQSIKKVSEQDIKQEPKRESTKPVILDKIPESSNKDQENTTSKTPFKYYFDDEERDKTKIVFYEKFFDQNTKTRDRDNFMYALEAFRLTNPTKQLYIDFIYGALLKMKEYNAHTHLEAYRKLMELFPIGPLRSTNAWQRDNLQYPRHQNCAIQILETMERNGVMPDEELGILVVKIFGDWTHAVRKVKRQLYWMPKFKNANPYAVPSTQVLETIEDYDLAKLALERMCVSADKQTKITAYYTRELDNHTEDTWILSAQSTKQRILLNEHKPEIPLFVEGPYFSWIRFKLVNYFVLKTDPLQDTLDTLKKIETYNEDDFKNMYNIFDDPFKQSNQLNKKPELSVHEQKDGVIYGVCCTGTNTKQSVIDWTKFLAETNPNLEKYVIVYRIKDKPGYLAILDNNEDKNK